MGKILTWLVSWLGIKGLKLVILGAYYTFIIAFYSFIINSLIVFYNLVHDILDYFSTNTDTDLSKFFGLLNCVGFTDAFLSSLPMFLSALTFLFTRILWKITINVKKDMIDKALKLI